MIKENYRLGYGGRHNHKLYVTTQLYELRKSYINSLWTDTNHTSFYVQFGVNLKQTEGF